MSTETQPTKFGTFGGVFTPCVLTILGVIMFLRFGQVIGNVGLWHGLAIVLCAKMITLLTAFSLSAIATNTKIRGGGAYFLISRSLGVEFGGVIGVVLFLAQAVSVSMYVIGFTEAFVAAFPSTGLSFRDIATIANIATFVCVFIGAGWTIRLQYGILAALVVSVIAFFAGAIDQFSMTTLTANLGPGDASSAMVFAMFALFFPAVTGIMAGANMSGDLSEPSKSIPYGTLAAIGATALIYLLMAVMLAGSAARDALQNDALIIKTLSVSPALITMGIFAATLSSALGSMMGAPRILQAFARDEVFASLRPFAKGSGRSGEPRRATVVTFLIAQAGIMLGDLNAIAPVITMFFMVTYGTLNLACFYEGITKNPSYRPRFRFSHWSIGLLGAIGCGVVMVLMNPLWAVISVLLISLLYFVISRAEIISRWGDIGSGIAFERARKALIKLEQEYFHPKNWRPAILAVSESAWSRGHVAEYAQWLAAGHGILTLAQLMPDVAENHIERRQNAERRLRKFIHEEGLSAFPVVVMEDSLPAGVESLLQSHGIGGMRPNTLVTQVAGHEENWYDFCESLRIADRYERSLLLIDCTEDADPWIAPEGSIDVLWQGAEHGQLMVLLGHLLKKNPEWRTKKLRILGTMPAKGNAVMLRESLEETLNQARIDASVHIFTGEDVFVTLAQRTGNTAALFVQFDPPESGEESDFQEWLAKYRKLIPDIVFVHSANRVSLQA